MRMLLLISGSRGGVEPMAAPAMQLWPLRAALQGHVGLQLAQIGVWL